MTWRRSLIYLLVLGLIGGYFYYFEVVRKERKETTEREAKRLYRLQKEDIQEIEIASRGQTPVSLEKKDQQWRIAQPVSTEVEKASLDSFLSALVGLSSEVTVGESVQDLKAYGLEDPALKIRFLASGQWTELSIGDKNPVSRGLYARTEKGGVCLVNESNWSLLNKGPNELRRRALFTFRPDQALQVDVAWEGGAHLNLQRNNEGEGVWRATAQPTLKIKPSKVENLLEQIQFLRAQSFVEEQAGPQELSRHGLQPARVTVKLHFSGDRLAELKLGQPASEGKDKSLVASSSELAGIVQIESTILKDIPKDIAEFEDRSLISTRSKDVKRVQWRFGGSSGSLTNIEANKWRLKVGEGEAREPKESWRVNSFLWELQQTEWSKRLDPAPPKPDQAYARIEIEAGEKQTTLTWEQSAIGNPKPVQVWLEEAGGMECVEVASEPLKKVEEEIGTLLAPAQQQP